MLVWRLLDMRIGGRRRGGGVVGGGGGECRARPADGGVALDEQAEFFGERLVLATGARLCAQASPLSRAKTSPLPQVVLAYWKWLEMALLVAITFERDATGAA